MSIFFDSVTVSFPENASGSFTTIGYGNKFKLTFNNAGFGKYESIGFHCTYSGMTSPTKTYCGQQGYIQYAGLDDIWPGGVNYNTRQCDISGFAYTTGHKTGTSEYTLVPASGMINRGYPAEITITLSGMYESGDNPYWDLLGTYVLTFAEQIPIITSDPISLNRHLGSSATFSVTAVSHSAMSYQWQVSSDGSNFTNIAGATSSSYTISSIGVGDVNKYYRVIVTNNIGGALSASAQLLTGEGPFIYSQPTSIVRYLGDEASFLVVAEGSGTVAYQWFKDSVALPNATGSSYYIQDVKITDAGDYNVTVSDVTGTGVSTEATLTVLGYRYQNSLYFLSGVIEKEQIVASDVNIPVPIGTDGVPLTFWDNVYRLDGRDIVVTDISGLVSYPREIVTFDKPSKSFMMWVKFPTLSSATDTPFLIQYGSNTVSEPNSADVWKGNYSGNFNHEAVYHFEPASYLVGTTSCGDQIFESRTNDSVGINHLRGNINHQWIDPDASQEIFFLPEGHLGNWVWTQNNYQSLLTNYNGDALMFARTLDDSSSLSFNTSSGIGDQPMTIRAWAWARGEEPDASGYSSFDWTDWPIVSKGIGKYQGEYRFGTTGDKLTFLTIDPNTSDQSNWAWNGVIAAYDMTGSGWGHFAATFTGASGAANYKLFLNGSQISGNYAETWFGSGTYSGMKDGPWPLEIGRSALSNYPGGTTYDYAWDTKWDELFILRGVMSSGQMRTQHNLESNFNNGVITYTGGEQEWDDNIYVQPPTTAAPTILDGLKSLTVSVGNSATFSVWADGTAPLSYDWSFNGTDIPGETGISYTIPSASINDAGTYAVTVSNIYGYAVSSATLNVVSSSGIVPGESGIVPGESGIVPSGEFPENLPSGLIYSDTFKFIDKNYSGIYATEASPIFNFQLGNLFYDQIKEDRVLFGSTSSSNKHFYVWVDSVNSGVIDNLELSLNGTTYSGLIDFMLEGDAIIPIYMKYTVEDNPILGFGTVLLKVGELPL